MKNIYFATVLILGFTQLGFSQAVPPLNHKQANIVFATEKHNFAVIPQNVPATYIFVFRNTGKEPLVISNATASCGCTVPEYTKEPVKPGGKGSIKVTYNAAGLGNFVKTVTVSSNAKKPTVTLTINGEVKAKDNKPAANVKTGSASTNKN